MMNLEYGKKDSVLYRFDVNGYVIDACYHKEDIEGIFIPLLKHLQQIYEEKKSRIFVYLAGPAGCGKSTLGLMLEKLAKELNMSFQCVGLDGFHYKQQYLIEHDLVSIKGHPMTFDVELLHQKLQEAMVSDCYWPIYSRTLHDPVDDGIYIDQNIVLVEGNYLLLDEKRWIDSKKFCSYSIFIKCDASIVKDRLIARKCRGGFSYEEACKHYEVSDSKNVEMILMHSVNKDVILNYDGVRYYKV